MDGVARSTSNISYHYIFYFLQKKISIPILESEFLILCFLSSLTLSLKAIDLKQVPFPSDHLHDPFLAPAHPCIDDFSG